MRLDLDQPRTLGELVAVTFDLFGRHLAVFLSLTLIGGRPDRAHRRRGVGPATWPKAAASTRPPLPPSVSVALGVLVIPPLVTALHVVVVQALARGEEPTVGGALRSASTRLFPAVAAVVLYWLGVAAGLLLLIVPGIWLRGPLVLRRAGGGGRRSRARSDALRRSAEVVQTRWWRTFGVLLAFGVVVGALGALGGALAHEIDNGALVHHGLDPRPDGDAVAERHLRHVAVLRSTGADRAAVAGHAARLGFEA